MAPCLAVRGDLDTAGAGPQLRAPPGCHMQLSLPSKAEPGRARAGTGRMGTVLQLTRPRQVRAELQITEDLQLDKICCHFPSIFSPATHQICSPSLLCASTAQGKFHLEVGACAVWSHRPVLVGWQGGMLLSLSFLLPAVAVLRIPFNWK